MVQDGNSARIHVGSQVPYTTIDTRENTSGVIDRFERVVIVPVGVQLEVLARIHRDSMITMQVKPEISAVVAFANNIPVVETSETSSTVCVLSGRTVILGGLIRHETRVTRKGIPILKHIPIVKYLFSSTVNSKTHTEIAVLLSPRIVSGREATGAYLKNLSIESQALDEEFSRDRSKGPSARQ
jgi:general secretion pathway protein D